LLGWVRHSLGTTSQADTVAALGCAPQEPYAAAHRADNFFPIAKWLFDDPLSDDGTFMPMVTGVLAMQSMLVPARG
jgi:hypothetical protein